MICLTCDVHHMSLNTGNQQHSNRSEVSIAADFSNLLAQQSIKATYFITGKCFAEEWYELRPICNINNIEIGGHTYDCFMPELWHRLWNKIAGNYNGPMYQQNRDIAKTKAIILLKTQKHITSWRNHMYMHGPNTDQLLIKNGIQICCDKVRRFGKLFEHSSSGIINFPINIIPDHEHLYHAERTRDWVERWLKRYNWSDDYGCQSYYFNQWFDIVKKEVLWRESNGLVSHLIIHPITLYLSAGFAALQAMVDFLSKFESTTVTQLISTHQKIKSTQSSSQILTCDS